ncbi:S41 family peptidase [Candidatus Hydrogenedentota bacterium]
MSKYDKLHEGDELLRAVLKAECSDISASSEECLAGSTLKSYLENTLSPEARANAEIHMDICSRCRTDLVALFRATNAADAEDTPDACDTSRGRIEIDLTAILGGDKLDSEQTPRTNKSPGKKLFMLVAALVVILSVTFFVTQTRQEQYAHTGPPVTGPSDWEPLDDKHFEVETAHGRERIEIMGEVAVFTHEGRSFDIPENVQETARALIEKSYYDASTAQSALEHDDIREVFKTLNNLETKGARSKLLPRHPNGILSPSDVLAYATELQGETVGIGVMHRPSGKGRGATIAGFADESPALEAGLKKGDIITHVDGSSITGLSLAEITKLLRGPAATEVDITVTRMNLPDITVSISRKSSKIRLLEHTIRPDGFAYVKLNGLSAETVVELTRVLEENANTCQGLILDLQSCIGGRLDIAETVADLFLPVGIPLFKITEPHGSRFITARETPLWTKPIAVVIGSHTRSAGELMAAAMKDTGRAITVGELTAGKGTVQTLFRFEEGFGIELTTKLVSGTGASDFNKVGVGPDAIGMVLDQKGDVNHIENAIKALKGNDT